MGTRGIYDTEGELFGYIEGSFVYTLAEEQVGEVKGTEVFNLENELMWLLRGDGLYTLTGEPVGYLGAERSEPHAPWQ